MQAPQQPPPQPTQVHPAPPAVAEIDTSRVEDRLAALEREDALLCAHSDLSGVSIFEEAFYRGVVAGESVLRRRGAGFTTLLRR